MLALKFSFYSVNLMSQETAFQTPYPFTLLYRHTTPAVQRKELRRNIHCILKTDLKHACVTQWAATYSIKRLAPLLLILVIPSHCTVANCLFPSYFGYPLVFLHIPAANVAHGNKPECAETQGVYPNIKKEEKPWLLVQSCMMLKVRLQSCVQTPFGKRDLGTRL